MPVCSRCHEEKPVEEFYRDPSRPGGVSSFCKVCKKVYGQEHHQGYKARRNILRKLLRPSQEDRIGKMAGTILREQENDRERSRRYIGLTRAQVEQMISDQKGCCPICGTDLLELDPRRVHVDHDHQTGKIRGVLCGHCNTMLGLARENIDTLKAAIAYLEEHS